MSAPASDEWIGVAEVAEELHFTMRQDWELGIDPRLTLKLRPLTIE